MIRTAWPYQSGFVNWNYVFHLSCWKIYQKRSTPKKSKKTKKKTKQKRHIPPSNITKVKTPVSSINVLVINISKLFCGNGWLQTCLCSKQLSTQYSARKRLAPRTCWFSLSKKMHSCRTFKPLSPWQPVNQASQESFCSGWINKCRNLARWVIYFHPRKSLHRLGHLISFKTSLP